MTLKRKTKDESLTQAQNSLIQLVLLSSLLWKISLSLLELQVSWTHPPCIYKDSLDLNSDPLAYMVNTLTNEPSSQSCWSWVFWFALFMCLCRTEDNQGYDSASGATCLVVGNRVSNWTQALPIWLGWLPLKCYYSWLFRSVLGIKLRSLCLYDKHFPT